MKQSRETCFPSFHPPARCAMASASKSVVWSGWAAKMHKGSKKWTDRYFVLSSDGLLTHYQYGVSPTAAPGTAVRLGPVQGVLDITGGAVEVLSCGDCEAHFKAREARLKKSLKPHRKLAWPLGTEPHRAFAIKTRKRTWYLIAEDAGQLVPLLQTYLSTGSFPVPETPQQPPAVIQNYAPMVTPATQTDSTLSAPAPLNPRTPDTNDDDFAKLAESRAPAPNPTQAATAHPQQQQDDDDDDFAQLAASRAGSKSVPAPAFDPFAPTSTQPAAEGAVVDGAAFNPFNPFG